MLDVAWPELFVVGAVALVAIGPKDMPKAMFALGRWAGKARRFVNEMRRAFNEIADEAEKSEQAVRRDDPGGQSPSR